MKLSSIRNILVTTSDRYCRITISCQRIRLISKALNKTSRKKLEQYQVLFFLLQTQPQYSPGCSANYENRIPVTRSTTRQKHIIMGLFGYAQKRREEYYLIKLITRSIKEEIQTCPSLQDWARCNSFWLKLFVAYVKLAERPESSCAKFSIRLSKSGFSRTQI